MSDCLNCGVAVKDGATCCPECFTPTGYWELEALEVYTNGAEIVVIGVPDDKRHDCDMMGCGTISNHVLAYADVTVAEWQAEAIEDE